MATMQAFAVYDQAANAYLGPWLFPTTAVALRAFEQTVADENSDFHKHAADYTIFRIGEWNTELASLTPLEHGHQNLGTALQILKEKQDR